MKAYERFLQYVSFDTQSDAASPTVPSTAKQKALGQALQHELNALGLADAAMDEYGYVYATLPASAGCEHAPALALIAHMDTAMDMSGANINPRIVHYQGGDIVLNQELEIVTRAEEFPMLQSYIGQDLIVTDGTTLLGGDDKAGVAEIVTLVEELLADPTLLHPTLKLVFTPDEEIGRGVDHINLARVGAAYGYTVDGGAVGDLQYENFNAASAKVTIHGVTAHTGYAKGVLRNAILVGMEYQALLPALENPACTEGREGFYHLDRMEARTERAVLHYLLRDHDFALYRRRQQMMRDAADFLNRKYGKGTVEVEIAESYRNMEEMIRPCMHLIENASLAMRQAGVEPNIQPVRGGTDGCRLSYMGLPCPNLCTGGQNGHGRHEFVSIQGMDKTVEILRNLVRLYAK